MWCNDEVECWKCKGKVRLRVVVCVKCVWMVVLHGFDGLFDWARGFAWLKGLFDWARAIVLCPKVPQFRPTPWLQT